MTKDEILAQALALSPTEREELAEAIQLSVGGPTDPAIDAAWAAECRRRIEAVDRGEMPTVDGDEVMRQLREQLKR